MTLREERKDGDILNLVLGSNEKLTFVLGLGSNGARKANNDGKVIRYIGDLRVLLLAKEEILKSCKAYELFLLL